MITALVRLLLLGMIGPLVLSAQGVTTGPSPLPVNTSPSVYLRGASDDTLDRIERLHIAGYRQTPAGTTFRVVLTDRRGNARSPEMERGSWQIRSGCRGETMATRHQPMVTGQSWQSDDPPTAAYILVDHSLTSMDIASPVLQSIADRAPGFAGMDSVGLAIFDHEIFEVSPIDAVYRMAPRCAGLPQLPPAGIPAVTLALRHGLSVLDARADEQKVLVLITASNDLASLGASITSCIDLARRADVMVNVVLVGPDVRGYEFRYLTSATGGCLYRLEEHAPGSAVDVLREILYSTKHHASVFVPHPTDNTTNSCTEQLFVIGWQDPDTTSAVVADTILVPSTLPELPNNRAVVAVFADSTNQGVEDYSSILQVIAEDLMADSTRVLQLVGHVSPDVSSNHDDRATERVAVVAEALQAAGVQPQQLRTRSDGSRRPLFYLQTDGVQRLLNNRVEAYYLRDADLPYTVLVGTYPSEEQALTWVSTWKQRGYSCYMEPILDRRQPAYEVRLWGFATESSARKAAQEAKKQHKASVATVE